MSHKLTLMVNAKTGSAFIAEIRLNPCNSRRPQPLIIQQSIIDLLRFWNVCKRGNLLHLPTVKYMLVCHLSFPGPGNHKIPVFR
ncbi:conserved hypothetical protein [Ricinus communis]|uniref:Uncharacterized protein n=1 Tax=Ricinus communis TaxID=3988 RepID=B9RD71_RICCO|nr:conserved hypothetical protein [Ricinus communis]